MECTFMKSADDIKLKGATDARKGRAALQRALDRLEQRVNRNPTKFNRNKCKALYLGGKTPCTDKGWGLGSSSAGTTRGVLADSKLSVGQPCALEVMTAGGILGCVK